MESVKDLRLELDYCITWGDETGTFISIYFSNFYLEVINPSVDLDLPPMPILLTIKPQGKGYLVEITDNDSGEIFSLTCDNILIEKWG